MHEKGGEKKENSKTCTHTHTHTPLRLAYDEQPFDKTGAVTVSAVAPWWQPDYSCIRLATPATLFSMHALHAAEYIMSLAEAIMRREDSTPLLFIRNKRRQITGGIVARVETARNIVFYLSEISHFSLSLSSLFFIILP